MSVKCTTCDKSCSFRKEPFSPDYTALLAHHNALVEAVEWLREVDDVREWLMEFPWLRKWSGLDQCMNEARAEVDRLIADCKGEG